MNAELRGKYSKPHVQHLPSIRSRTNTPNSHISNIETIDSIPTNQSMLSDLEDKTPDELRMMLQQERLVKNK